MPRISRANIPVLVADRRTPPARSVSEWRWRSSTIAGVSDGVRDEPPKPIYSCSGTRRPLVAKLPERAVATRTMCHSRRRMVGGDAANRVDEGASVNSARSRYASVGGGCTEPGSVRFGRATARFGFCLDLARPCWTSCQLRLSANGWMVCVRHSPHGCSPTHAAHWGAPCAVAQKSRRPRGATQRTPSRAINRAVTRLLLPLHVLRR